MSRVERIQSVHIVMENRKVVLAVIYLPTSNLNHNPFATTRWWKYQRNPWSTFCVIKHWIWLFQRFICNSQNQGIYTSALYVLFWLQFRVNTMNSSKKNVWMILFRFRGIPFTQVWSKIESHVSHWQDSSHVL